MATGSWLNSDGLLIGFGVAESYGDTGGEYPDVITGSIVYDFVIPMSALSTATPVYANLLNQIPVATSGFVTRDFFPTNFLLEKVELFTEQTVTGSSGTLNVGFWDITANTVISATGAVATATLASLATVGTLTTLTVGATYAGAKLGQVVYSAPGYNTGVPFTPHQIGITAQIGSGTFTGGAVRVRLWGRRSLATDTSSSVDD